METDDAAMGFEIAIEACLEIMEANMQLTLDIEHLNARTGPLAAENANLRQAVRTAQRALQLRAMELSNRIHAQRGVPPVYQ